MTLPHPSDFVEVFTNRFTTSFAKKLIEIIKNSAYGAYSYCDQNFKAKNYAQTQGMLRRQFIADKCQTSAFDGGVIAEALDFKGNLLEGDERVNNFVLLIARDVALIVSRATQHRPIPGVIPIRQYFSSRAFAVAPLFDELVISKNQRDDIKAFFVVRYWLDQTDSSAVESIDVVVLNAQADEIFCNVCDLQSYANSLATSSLEAPLPISMLETSIDIEVPTAPTDFTNPQDNPSRSSTDDLLDMKLFSESEHNRE